MQILNTMIICDIILFYSLFISNSSSNTTSSSSSPSVTSFFFKELSSNTATGGEVNNFILFNFLCSILILAADGRAGYLINYSITVLKRKVNIL